MIKRTQIECQKCENVEHCLFCNLKYVEDSYFKNSVYILNEDIIR